MDSFVRDWLSVSGVIFALTFIVLQQLRIGMINYHLTEAGRHKGEAEKWAKG